MESPKRRNCLYGSWDIVSPPYPVFIRIRECLERTVGAVARISFAGALKGIILTAFDIRAGEGNV
jgi:hypothetical protein